MKKLMRLLALTLAAAMLLSVGALAAGNESSGPKLVANWLDWNEGHFVNDDAISGRNYGDEEMHIAPGDEHPVIFFSIGEDGKRTPVLPKAGKGVTIRKLNEDEIASGAKHSDYYVCVSVADWNGGEVTSGKATMKIIAELPDTGLYTTAEATKSGYISGGQGPVDPSTLTDKTVYFISTATDEANGRHVTDVKKNDHGNSNMYDLEKAGDNVWKITLKIPEDGGAGVNLDITWQDTDGNTYTDERGWGFEYPHGPELWHSWLDWNDDGPYLRDDAGQGRDLNIVPGDEPALIFYTCDYDDKGEPTYTPVPFSKLKASKGITLTSLKDESSDKLADCFVRMTVDEWNLKGTVSSGDYTLKVTSDLPDFGIYSKPELTTDSFLRTWRFSPLNPCETVYIGSYIPENDDRVLTDLKLAKFEGSDQFTLEKYNDQFYKLTRKSLEMSDMDVMFEATWKWSDGHTETWDNSVWMEPWMNELITDKSVGDIRSDTPILYEDVKSQLSDKITMNVGETKPVYLYITYPWADGAKWSISAMGIPTYWTGSDDGLKVTHTGGEDDVVQFSVTASKPGTYQIVVKFANDFDLTLFHADGTKYTAAELAKWEEENTFDPWSGDKLYLFDEEAEKWVPFKEVYPDESFEIKLSDWEQNEWFPITVTVTGEAPKPAFPDVKSSDWFAPAVAFANSNGYMTGSTSGKFEPTGLVKGSEFAQILYNKEGKPAAADGAVFQGVDKQWYAPAILWAAGKGIITDTGDTAVVPEKELTREQIALMLYNYMGKPAATGDLSKFADADKVSAWALDAVKWAVSEGILNGSEDKGVLNLLPTGTATRAQTAQILMNFFG